MMRKRTITPISGTVAAFSDETLLRNLWPSSSADKVSEAELNQRRALFQHSIRPLIFSMRMIGLYFDENSENSPKVDESQKSNDRGGALRKSSIDDEKIKRRCSFSKFYSTLCLLLVWFNLFRMCTVFTAVDSGRPQAIIGKFTAVNFSAMCTFMFTSYYYACSSGKFPRTLRQLQTYDFEKAHLRTTIWICVIIAWLFVLANSGFIAYTLFIDPGHIGDSLITPLTTQITTFNPNILVPIRVVASLCYVFLNAAWALSTVATFALSGAFSHLFCMFNGKFKAALDRNGKFNDRFDAQRLKHQRICRMVNSADKYLAVFFATSVLSNIAAIITILFTAIWYPPRDAVSIGISIFWLVGSTVILGSTVIGSMIVNSKAHKIYDRVHDLDLAALDSDTVGQVSVFLKRLTAEPIGFSVLRIFVIDRTTILTIFGMLITYFLLIIQLSPPPSITSTSAAVSNSNSTASQ